MWSFFDKFIDLMEPENMAKFMTRIFPQMMDAMPIGMDRMMRGMKHVPGGLALMEKMMPLMFPYLAPGILGKVMPDMIREVEDVMGEMPADMAELMPDLLPKTMDSLMPTYLPQLIPHLTPLFIDYVRNEGKPAVAGRRRLVRWAAATSPTGTGCQEVGRMPASCLCAASARVCTRWGITEAS